jgi:hypothetical protein
MRFELGWSAHNRPVDAAWNGHCWDQDAPAMVSDATDAMLRTMPFEPIVELPSEMHLVIDGSLPAAPNAELVRQRLERAWTSASA